MLQVIPSTKSHIYGKFHENPFRRFFCNVANRRADKQTNKTNSGENITLGRRNFGGYVNQQTCLNRSWAKCVLLYT